MMPVEMRSVYSSWVSEIGYDPETKELVTVTQTGVRLIHAPVEAAAAARILSAPSIGAALHAEGLMRPGTQHRKGG
jgi:hypothetical protein